MDISELKAAAAKAAAAVAEIEPKAEVEKLFQRRKPPATQTVVFPPKNFPY